MSPFRPCEAHSQLNNLVVDNILAIHFTGMSCCKACTSLSLLAGSANMAFTSSNNFWAFSISWGGAVASNLHAHIHCLNPNLCATPTAYEDEGARSSHNCFHADPPKRKGQRHRIPVQVLNSLLYFFVCCIWYRNFVPQTADQSVV